MEPTLLIHVVAGSVGLLCGFVALYSVKGTTLHRKSGSIFVYAMLAWGVQAIANGGQRNGMPAFPFFMFATFGLLGAFGDLRVMRSGALQGASRLARHLWRMSIALFLAALSFSVQAASMLARSELRLPGGVIALPMVLVLATMLYWLWRVRVRQRLRGIVQVSAPRAVAS